MKNPAQCSLVFSSDTMTIPGGKVIEGNYLESTMKNGSVFRFFSSSDNKIYLRMILTKNFYFDKTDLLEIRSGKMSYYEKNTKQYKVSKTAGLMMLEVFPNYLVTLKERGITSVVFAGAETHFTRQDVKKVRELAACMAEKKANKK
jgi:hypothetical protein